MGLDRFSAVQRPLSLLDCEGKVVAVEAKNACAGNLGGTTSSQDIGKEYSSTAGLVGWSCAPFSQQTPRYRRIQLVLDRTEKPNLIRATSV